MKRTFDKPNIFGRDDVKVLDSKLGFKGFGQLDVIKLKHRLFNGGWSEVIEREVLLKGEVAHAILYDPQNDLVGLVEQFRIGAMASEEGPWRLECVAGMMEKGETPEDLIRRELFEEAGINDAKLIAITAYYPTPGSCDEYAHLYCALCRLDDAEGDFGLTEESEDIRLHVYSASEVFSAMLKGRTNNAATLIGLQWLQANRKHLRDGDHKLDKSMKQ